MAIALVQAHDGGFSSTGTATSALTGIAAGHLLVASMWWNEASVGADIISLTDTFGNLYQQIPNCFIQIVTTHFGTMYQRVAYCQNCNGGAGVNTLTAPFSGAPGFCEVALQEFSGVATSSCLDVSAGATGTGTTPTVGPVTPTVNNELVFAVSVSDGSSVFIPVGTGFTTTYGANNAGTGNWTGEYKVQTTATPVTPTFGPAGVSVQYLASVAVFSPTPIIIPGQGLGACISPDYEWYEGDRF